MLPECDLTLVETDPRDDRCAPNRGCPVPASGRPTESSYCAAGRSVRRAAEHLPWPVTEQLVAILPFLDIRRAVVSASPATSFSSLIVDFDVSLVDTVGGTDFTPTQPGISHLIKLVSRRRR